MTTLIMSSGNDSGTIRVISEEISDTIVKVVYEKKPKLLHLIEEGPRGASGESAYQAWLDEGNVGSKEDFLESLKGPPGLSEDIDYTLYYNLSKG